MQQCFITSYTLRASTLPIANSSYVTYRDASPSSLEWVDGGKDYYCAQQLYLGDSRLRVSGFNAWVKDFMYGSSNIIKSMIYRSVTPLIRERLKN